MMEDEEDHEEVYMSMLNPWQTLPVSASTYRKILQALKKVCLQKPNSFCSFLVPLSSEINTVAYTFEFEPNLKLLPNEQNNACLQGSRSKRSKKLQKLDYAIEYFSFSVNGGIDDDVSLIPTF